MHSAGNNSVVPSCTYPVRVDPDLSNFLASRACPCGLPPVASNENDDGNNDKALNSNDDDLC